MPITIRVHASTRFLALCFAAFAMVACGDGTSPLPSEGRPSGVSIIRYTGTDTASTGFPSRVIVAGRVVPAGTGVPTDTGVVVSAAGLPGRTVRALRNQLVNGAATQTEMGRVVSGTDGAYRFENLPGGYYVMEVLGPGDAVLSYELLATTSTSNWRLLFVR
jgi:hypothetical protein